MTTKNPERPVVLVVGSNFTPESDFALDQAACMAARIPGCDFRVIRAVEPGTDEARITQLGVELGAYVNAMSRALGIHLTNVGIHVRPGDAAKEIATLAAELVADVIVVGTRLRPGLKELFVGSVGDRLTEIATCTVLIASPKHAASAVPHEPCRPARLGH